MNLLRLKPVEAYEGPALPAVYAASMFLQARLAREISQTPLPWQERTAKLSQVSCSKEVSLIFADITEEQVTSQKIGHKISAHALQFHGQIFQLLPEEKAGQTGSMQTKTFVCASLDTDQNMKASFSCFTRAGNSNLDT